MYKEAIQFHKKVGPIVVLLMIAVFVLTGGLESSGSVPVHGGIYVSFEQEVKPVFQNRCSSCHNSQSKLPNILDYNVAYGLRTTIKNKVSEERSMPHFGYMKESERDLVNKWVETGAQK